MDIQADFRMRLGELDQRKAELGIAEGAGRADAQGAPCLAGGGACFLVEGIEVGQKPACPGPDTLRRPPSAPPAGSSC